MPPHAALTARIYALVVRGLVLALSALAVVLAQVGSAAEGASSSTRVAFKEAGPGGSKTVLSRHDVSPTFSSLSPDARQLAFVPYFPMDGRSHDLWVVDVRGPSERLLLQAAGWLGEVAWAPGGQAIAFSQYGFGADGIWLVDPDGSNVRRVADYSRSFAWSPDSRQLAYVRWENGHWALGILDVASGTTRDLADGSEPRWSPDGQRVVYQRNLGCFCQPEIRVLSVSTGSSRPLARGSTPFWSPDGRRIGYMRARHNERSTLWAIRSSGGSPRLLASNLSGSFSYPVWSQDGGSIAFVRDFRRGTSLDIVAASGAGRPRRLTAESGVITPLAWRGRRVLYLVAR